ncbi:kinesin-domain-containing protein [Hesseltinella vesiculosa]|uniref:Kinesin-like protein unc-104 n=1 Tax=Hesseltinella vesiculosa TaxID=101127 RepID=A0A1X2GD25_9FUNG|nr:kinesin-domain-containing protein [Hesseltinella vesiculosa]
MSGGNIKVVVRCRPLNSRELQRGATCLIRMEGDQTIISRPPDQRTGKDNEDIKAFTFDKSYWSADKSDSSYADQQTVYSDLGVDLLNHAFDGYNCCIFAYGQTGSGKSYSMMGYGEDKGIIPRTCSELFNRINQSTEENVTYRVEVSYIEIYNEKVRDLLNPKNKGNLKVREHPSTGPYVEDLSRLVVSSFDDINHLMDEGNKARTVAATNMNETSSRSHAVFTLFLTQKRKDELTSLETEKVARISLVDLAGSERANSTGATGTRLKEGANINRSLTTLGKVIAGLAEQSMAEGKKGKNGKQVFVPYRDSILTWLLKDSLGGNSKTAMIAAISPADYDETLSTLRYADQAKKIKNKAVVNEDPNAKMIRELKDELELLRDRLRTYAPEEVEQLTASSAFKRSGSNSQISAAAGAGPRSTPGKINPNQTFEVVDGQGNKKVMSKQEIVDQLQSSEKLLANLNETWEEKLKKTEEIQKERERALAELGIAVHKNNVGVYAPKTMPHLVNLNEDPLMSECLMYQLKVGVTRVGRSDSKQPADIRLSGTNIRNHHCSFENNNGTVTLTPGDDSLTFVNGKRLEAPERLRSGYRIILGDYHIFRFNHPEEARRERDMKKLELDETAERPESPTTTEVMDWNYARREAVLNYYATETDFNGLKDEELEKLYDDITRVRKSRRTRPNDDDDDESHDSIRNISTPTMEDGESVSTDLTFAHSELEERFKVEKERMRMELDNQKRQFEAKINRMSRQFSQQTMALQAIAGTSQPQHPLSHASLTDQQLSLLQQAVKHWRGRRDVSMAETVLSNAIILKEANIIARELGKDVLYQFTVMDDDAFAFPQSYWETTSALHPFETDEDASFVSSTKPCIGVRVHDREHQVMYVWSLEKLKVRLQKMRNLYHFIDRPSYLTHFNWEDPFFERPCPMYSFVGSARLCLRNLLTMQAYESSVPVIDPMTGQTKATLHVVVLPIARSMVQSSHEEDDDQDMFMPDDRFSLHDMDRDDLTDHEENSPSIANGQDHHSKTVNVRRGEQLLFEIRLTKLCGISEEEYTKVHVQFKRSSFGDVAADSIQEKWFATSPVANVGPLDTVPLQFSQTMTLVVTDAVLTKLTNGMLPLEVFGVIQPKVLTQLERWDEQREKKKIDNTPLDTPPLPATDTPTSPIPAPLPPTASPSLVIERRPEEELLVMERHDVLAWVQVSELLPSGEYQPVETMTEHTLDRGLFTLRQGLQRRIKITLYHTSGRQLEWQRISNVTLGKIRQLTAKGRMVDAVSMEAVPIKLLNHSQMTSPSSSSSLLPHQAKSKKRSASASSDHANGMPGATYFKDGTSQLSIQGAWDSSQHDCIFLNQITPNKTRIVLQLSWQVEVSKCAKPMTFAMDIAVRITGRDANPASRFKKLLSSPKRTLAKCSGLFAVQLTPPMTRRVDQLWRLNTASKYIRGQEEYLGHWRPRGVSLIHDHQHIRQQWDLQLQVQRTLQSLALRSVPPSTTTSTSSLILNKHSSLTAASIDQPLSLPPSPPPSLKNDNEKTALLKKILDLWSRRFGTEQEITISQEPPLTGSYHEMITAYNNWQHTTNLLSEVKLITQGSSVTKKGYVLYQEDALEDIWSKRWFVMRRPYIYIYEDDSERDELGVINVTSVRVDYNRELEKLIQRTHVFALYTSNNAYTVQANTRHEMMDWITKVDQKFPVDQLLD